MKQLYPSYELSWRTEEDKRFSSSAAWKRIRQMILERDNYTCQYCGFRSDIISKRVVELYAQATVKL